MIARACEWNPSVFRKSGEKDDIFNVSETICMSSILNYKRIFPVIETIFNLRNNFIPGDQNIFGIRV